MCQLCAQFTTKSAAFGGTIVQPLVASSSSNINALAEYSWNANAGTGNNITYSFNNLPDNTIALTAGQQANTILALAAWAKVANVTFTQISGDADIDFGFGDLASIGENVAGVAYQTLSGPTQLSAVEVVIDDNTEGDWPVESSNFEVMLHEIGHALGLKHPFEGSPQLSSALDNKDFTVMSYTDGPQGLYSHSTPMINDIAAVQYIYGANTTATAGNDVYQISPGGVGSTIWDAGGTDTLEIINASGVAANIDLRSGYSNRTEMGFSDTWIFDGVVIEHIISGNGSDTLNGNSTGNRIFAGLGNDTVSGNEGNDTICGGVNFSDTADTHDVLYGNAGSDIIYGNGGDDSIFGGSGLSDASETGNDILYGGAGTDKLYGNGGNDTLVGAIGNDTLYGGGGDDRFVMNSGGGIDWIWPFQGAGAAGGDVLKVDLNINGTGITTAADVIARASSDGSHTYVDLGSGNGVLVLFTMGLLGVDDILVL